MKFKISTSQWHLQWVWSLESPSVSHTQQLLIPLKTSLLTQSQMKSKNQQIGAPTRAVSVNVMDSSGLALMISGTFWINLFKAQLDATLSNLEILSQDITTFANACQNCLAATMGTITDGSYYASLPEARVCVLRLVRQHKSVGPGRTFQTGCLPWDQMTAF